jgi:hypothetical protein
MRRDFQDLRPRSDFVLGSRGRHAVRFVFGVPRTSRNSEEERAMAKSSTLSPIDDLTYDVITVLQHKAQALGAYDKYIGDAQSEEDGELEELFIEMRKTDEQNVLVLKEALARRLDEDLGYEDDEELGDDVDTEDYDDEEDEADEVEVEAPEEVDAATTPASPTPSSRRGESSQRQR